MTVTSLVFAILKAPLSIPFRGPLTVVDDVVELAVRDESPLTVTDDELDLEVASPLATGGDGLELTPAQDPGPVPLNTNLDDLQRWMVRLRDNLKRGGMID